MTKSNGHSNYSAGSIDGSSTTQLSQLVVRADNVIVPRHDTRISTNFLGVGPPPPHTHTRNTALYSPIRQRDHFFCTRHDIRLSKIIDHMPMIHSTEYGYKPDKLSDDFVPISRN